MGHPPCHESGPQASAATTSFRVGLLLLALAACSDAAGPDEPGLPEPAGYTVRMVASVGLPIDSAVVRLEGPTPHTFRMVEGEEVVLDSLPPGSYVVAVEGWRDEWVAGFTEFEETFEAGEQREREVTFEGAFAPAEFSATPDAGLIQLQWDSVPGAMEYRVEVKASPEAVESEFEGRTEETSLQIGPFDAGSYTGLVQAVDRFGNEGPPATVVATIEPTRFPVTVQVEEGGELPVGSVVSEPDGILCGDGNDQCEAEFPAGEEVVLKHVWPGVPQDGPDYGTGFGGWAGDCSGLDSCVLTVDGPKAVAATAADELVSFALDPFIVWNTELSWDEWDYFDLPALVRWRLTWEEAGGTCEQYVDETGANSPPGSDCSVRVAPGTRLTISSPVGPVDWVSGCESAEGNTCHAVVSPGSGTGSVWAEWAWSPPQGHSQLQVFRSEVGVVRSDVPGIYGWPGQDPYPLVCGGPDGWLRCSQVYPDGTTVTLTAEPIEGYRFTGWMSLGDLWSGSGCSGIDPCEIAVDEQIWVRASFEPTSLGIGFGLEQFSLIPAGTFQMGDIPGNGSGDERPVHTVNITRDFYMQRTEVTQAQWREIMGENPSQYTGCDLCPVEQVSWEDVQTFLVRLNEAYPEAHFRLPTEAEWEYAARAGTTGDFGGTGVADDMGWYITNTPGGAGTSWADGKKYQPVALKLPNDWGLYDMHGNVYEWVQDWYSATYYSVSPTNDPTGPPSDPDPGSDWPARVLRSGSFLFGSSTARSSARSSDHIQAPREDQGFRLVRTR